MMNKIVLGIETSCDDTSVCLLQAGKNSNSYPEILFHKSYGQVESLAKWQGVVPEIAARNHLAKIGPLLEEAFSQTNIKTSEVSLIGVTTHPGLLGPLLTGLNAAKTLSLVNEIPIVPVNHLYAHLEAIHLTQTVSYPYLGLLVSGGHSIFFLVKDEISFEILGSTIDDAAGEAFDKGGKLLGLGYPAGHLIDQLSQWGDPLKYEFPIGLKSSADSRLSYSGLKTSLRVLLEKNPGHALLKFTPHSSPIKEFQSLYDLAASYQHAIVAALSLKLKYALQSAKEKTGPAQLPIVVGGGVACNSELRAKLKTKYSNIHFVEKDFCTDNGAMIANYALRAGQKTISFPECLYMDARGRFLDKKEFN